MDTPLRKEGRGRILPAKEGHQGLLKAAAKNHGSLRVPFPPAIEIAVPVAAWAAQVLPDLAVTQDHAWLPFAPVPLHVAHESASHSPAGAKASRF